MVKREKGDYRFGVCVIPSCVWTKAFLQIYFEFELYVFCVFVIFSAKSQNGDVEQMKYLTTKNEFLHDSIVSQLEILEKSMKKREFFGLITLWINKFVLCFMWIDNLSRLNRWKIKREYSLQCFFLFCSLASKKEQSTEKSDFYDYHLLHIDWICTAYLQRIYDIFVTFTRWHEPTLSKHVFFSTSRFKSSKENPRIHG